MVAKIALEYADIVIIVACIALLAMVVRSRSVKTYAFLVALLAVRGITTAITLGILFHRHELGISVQHAYNIYFYSYWTSTLLQIVLQMLTIYSVYKVAMKPLEGIQRMGTIIFRWVATVSLVLSVVVALGPHATGTNYLAVLLGQAQEGVSILTVCLLVFVCFAAKPLGLTFRSRPFGIALGLGFASTASLVLSAWLSTSEARSLYAPVFAVGAVASAISILIWGVYFALPEPERRMVMLPTTSPYFLWNSISEALGDEPGEVAVAGFTPAMLAPAEMLALSASTAYTTQQAPSEAVPALAV